MTGALQDCPCNGCTTKDGRGPGCHNPGCPRGWYEWDQLHQAEREARREFKMHDRRAEGVLVEAQIKSRPGRGVRRK